MLIQYRYQNTYFITIFISHGGTIPNKEAMKYPPISS